MPMRPDIGVLSMWPQSGLAYDACHISEAGAAASFAQPRVDMSGRALRN